MAVAIRNLVYSRIFPAPLSVPISHTTSLDAVVIRWYIPFIGYVRLDFMSPQLIYVAACRLRSIWSPNFACASLMHLTNGMCHIHSYSRVHARDWTSSRLALMSPVSR